MHKQETEGTEDTDKGDILTNQERFEEHFQITNININQAKATMKLLKFDDLDTIKKASSAPYPRIQISYGITAKCRFVDSNTESSDTLTQE